MSTRSAALPEAAHQHLVVALHSAQSECAAESGASLRDISLSWLRFGYQGPVLEAPNIDDLLEQALKAGYRRCFVIRPGYLVAEKWLLPHWQADDFHSALRRHAGRDDFLLSAAIRPVHTRHALDSSAILINLERYQTLGRPRFATWLRSAQAQRIALPTTHAQIQEGADGLQISAAAQLQQAVAARPDESQTGQQDLWRCALSAGLVIPDLPAAVKENATVVTSADQGHEHHLEAVSEKTGSDAVRTKHAVVQGIEQQIRRGRDGVFLWNIESYDDITPLLTASTTKLGHLCCVAAGFKPNMLLRCHGVDAKTQVSFFDYSAKALEIRQYLIEQWDGYDYPAFCRQVLQRFPSTQVFYQLWNGISPAQIDWHDVEQLWQQELQQWGGAEAFAECWQQQQRLQYRFFHCDILSDRDALLDEIAQHYHADHGETAIWWSNAFFTISSNWLLSIEQRRHIFTRWIEQLAQRAPACHIYGADHINTPINHIRAQEYALQLSQDAELTHNELTPNRHRARALRF